MSDLLIGRGHYGTQTDPDPDPLSDFIDGGAVFRIDDRIRDLRERGLSPLEAVQRACNELNVRSDTVARCGWCRAYHRNLNPGRDRDGIPQPMCHLNCAGLLI